MVADIELCFQVPFIFASECHYMIVLLQLVRKTIQLPVRQKFVNRIKISPLFTTYHSTFHPPAYIISGVLLSYN